MLLYRIQLWIMSDAETKPSEQNKMRSSRKLFWEKHILVGLQDGIIQQYGYI